MNKFLYKIKHKKKVCLIVIITIIVSVSGIVTGTSFPGKNNPPAFLPEFTQVDPAAWINSKPLSIKDLRGKVLLVDIWTFGCWNCYRSFPWLRGVEEKFANQDFQVIGIHTPEFEREKKRENVVKKVQEFMLHHPVMIDNDFAYWNTLNNRYWPTYYIVDKRGNIRDVFVGETHEGDARAEAIETLIAKLLQE